MTNYITSRSLSAYPPIYYYPKAWVLARVNFGATSITFPSSRANSVTATRNGVANYTLTWTSTGSATSYVQLSCAAPGNTLIMAKYINLTATGCTPYLLSATNTFADADFNIRVDK